MGKQSVKYDIFYTKRTGGHLKVENDELPHRNVSNDNLTIDVSETKVWIFDQI